MLIISATKASTPSRAAKAKTRFCSRTDAGPGRSISRSRPSGKIRTGFEPVVLAKTARPEARRAAATWRVTADFPRVPVTQIRRGTRARSRASRRRSRRRNPPKRSRRMKPGKRMPTRVFYGKRRKIPTPVLAGTIHENAVFRNQPQKPRPALSPLRASR